MSPTLMDTEPTPPHVGQQDSQAVSPQKETSVAGNSPFAVSDPLFTQTGRESVFSPIVEIFVGPDGLYPGARCLIYIFLVFVTLGILNSFLHGLSPAQRPLWWSIVNETCMMIAAVLPAFIMARVEGRRFGDFGLPAKAALGRNFWMGAIWGITALSVLMLMLRGAGAFSFGSLAIHGPRIFKFAFYYAVFFLVTGVFEEFLMRGYSQWVLTQSMRFWPAAALLSILFGLIHLVNGGETRVGIFAVMCLGFFFCLTLRRTGNLWWAVGFHMSWDWGESYLYSVPDSGGISRGHLLNSSFQGPDWLTGGSVGPEGSYLVFALLVALWIVFGHLYPDVKYEAPGNKESR